jgi:DNA-directed RNA polymerase alpha subunit
MDNSIRFGGMMLAEKRLKVCEKGHTFYKSTDCPNCPTCNQENKPSSGFLSKLSSPARNALLHAGIDTLEKLSTYTEKDIVKMHDIGPASLPTMRSSLEEEGLSFK